MTHPVTERKGCGDTLWMWLYVLVSLAMFWHLRLIPMPESLQTTIRQMATASWSEWQQFSSEAPRLPVQQCIYAVIARFFGVNMKLWVAAAAIWHGINAWMVYNLVRRLLTVEGGKAEVLPPLAAAILFLISPFHAETVAGLLTIHLIAGGYFLLKVLHRTLDFVETEEQTPLYLSLIWLAAALLTVPWSALVPVLAAIVCWGFYAIRNQRAQALRTMARFFAPQMLLLVLAVFFYQNVFKQYWTNTEWTSAPEIVFHGILNVTFFAAFWNQNVLDAVRSVFNHVTAVIVVWAVVVSAAVLFFQKFQRYPIHLQWAVLAFVALVVALLPCVTQPDSSESTTWQSSCLYAATIFNGIFISLIFSRLRGWYPFLMAAMFFISAFLLRCLSARPPWSVAKQEQVAPSDSPAAEKSHLPDTLASPLLDSASHTPQ